MPRLTILASLTASAFPALAHAQLELPRPSPNAQVMQQVGLTEISVAYSSPGVKNREIWGKLVPYDTMWRTGANRDTTITFGKDVKFGGKAVSAGTYTLYTIPSKKGWTVVLNSNPEDFNHANYDEKKDVARVKAIASHIPPRERLTFLFADTTDDRTRLDMEWEKLRISVPIEVDTKTQALAAIKEKTSSGWLLYAQAANYLQENGDLTTALENVETSIALKKTWRNQWVKAQILAKQGKNTDAIAAAREAHRLGDDSLGYKITKAAIDQAIASWKGNKS